MELKIVDKETKEGLAEAFGISKERQDEIAAKMDDMIEEFRGRGSKGISVYSSETFNTIANMCDNLEEYTFAVLSHSSYMRMVYGHEYCPLKRQKT